MDKQRGVATQLPQSPPSDSLEENGIPPETKKRPWLFRQLHALKNAASKIFRSRVVPDSKPLSLRQIDETNTISPVINTRNSETPPVTPEESKTTGLLSKVQKRIIRDQLIRNPLKFALQCIDENQKIPSRFFQEALIPGLQKEWQETTKIDQDTATTLAHSLVDIIQLQNIQVDDQFMDAYQYPSKFAPLSPEEKFKLLQEFNHQLKQNPDKKSLQTIQRTLESHKNMLKAIGTQPDRQQSEMETLTEYLLHNVSDLPALTTKGLAACAHFSQYIESTHYRVPDKKAEMDKFIQFMTENPTVYTSMQGSAIAAHYIVDAPLAQELKDVLPEALIPYKSSEDEPPLN